MFNASMNFALGDDIEALRDLVHRWLPPPGSEIHGPHPRSDHPARRGTRSIGTLPRGTIARR